MNLLYLVLAPSSRNVLWALDEQEAERLASSNGGRVLAVDVVDVSIRLDLQKLLRDQNREAEAGGFPEGASWK